MATATKRRVFYSFHYKEDVWRTSQVRHIGLVDGSRPATDNDWETVKRGGDQAIARWIKSQMSGRTCTNINSTPMDSIVKCYTPSGRNSKEKYAWIEEYLSAMVEEAIQIRSSQDR